MTQQLFSLYAIYVLADGDDGERFDTQLLPIDLAEGVRSETSPGASTEPRSRRMNTRSERTHSIN
jgi:hypothetical protein